MSAMSRRKGAVGEREVVNRHKDNGIHADRIVLSGAIKNQRMGDGHDVDVIPSWRLAPLCGEVKRGSHVPKSVARWLADNDFLAIRRDRGDWVYVIPERIWMELLKR
jgi:hypothetical protein